MFEISCLHNCIDYQNTLILTTRPYNLYDRGIFQEHFLCFKETMKATKNKIIFAPSAFEKEAVAMSYQDDNSGWKTQNLRFITPPQRKVSLSPRSTIKLFRVEMFCFVFIQKISLHHSRFSLFFIRFFCSFFKHNLIKRQMVIVTFSLVKFFFVAYKKVSHSLDSGSADIVRSRSGCRNEGCHNSSFPSRKFFNFNEIEHWQLRTCCIVSHIARFPSHIDKTTVKFIWPRNQLNGSKGINNYRPIYEYVLKSRSCVD